MYRLCLQNRTHFGMLLVNLLVQIHCPGGGLSLLLHVCFYTNQVIFFQICTIPAIGGDQETIIRQPNRVCALSSGKQVHLVRAADQSDHIPAGSLLFRGDHPGNEVIHLFVETGIGDAAGIGIQVVDGSIEIVKSRFYPAFQTTAADDLLAKLLGLVVQKHHMVTIPTDGTGDVQSDLREEGQQRRHFVRNHFCGVIVTVVHQRNAAILIHSSIAQGKFCRTHGVGFYTDAENLAFHAGLYLLKIEGLGKNFIDGFLITNTGTHTVCGDILKAVTGPDIHNTGLTQFFC